MKSTITFATLLAMASSGVCQYPGAPGYVDTSPNAPVYNSQEPWVKLWWEDENGEKKVDKTEYKLDGVCHHDLEGYNGYQLVGTTRKVKACSYAHKDATCGEEYYAIPLDFLEISHDEPFPESVRGYRGGGSFSFYEGECEYPPEESISSGNIAPSAPTASPKAISSAEGSHSSGNNVTSTPTQTFGPSSSVAANLTDGQ